MTALNDPTENPSEQSARRADTVYALILFIAAAVALAIAIQHYGFLAGSFGAGTAAFFVVYGLFTITMGFPHPGFGHVSFDRVAQIAAILVLGPTDAAWISGVASLLYPWQRLWDGESLIDVITASLHNAGLMTLVVLGCGLLYVAAGGTVPIATLDSATVGLLLLLILSMQLANDIGMLAIFRMRNQDASKLLNRFTTSIELGSVLIAVLVALVYVRYERPVLILLLVVLSIGMLVLKRYAEMRASLEALVEDRTEELRIKTRELEKQATHDPLTGLYNRRFADEFLEHEIDRARRSAQPFTLALADIDRFKLINDRYSHAAGDAVLQQVADILAQRCRQTDIVARYGGEEFLLCFPDTDIEFARQICGQLRGAIESAEWAGLAGEDASDLTVTISFGVVQSDESSRKATLLVAADERLYRAKRAGRNRVIADASTL